MSSLKITDCNFCQYNVGLRLPDDGIEVICSLYGTVSFDNNFVCLSKDSCHRFLNVFSPGHSEIGEPKKDNL